MRESAAQRYTVWIRVCDWVNNKNYCKALWVVIKTLGLYRPGNSLETMLQATELYDLDKDLNCTIKGNDAKQCFFPTVARAVGKLCWSFSVDLSFHCPLNSLVRSVSTASRAWPFPLRRLCSLSTFGKVGNEFSHVTVDATKVNLSFSVPVTVGISATYLLKKYLVWICRGTENSQKLKVCHS